MRSCEPTGVSFIQHGLRWDVLVGSEDEGHGVHGWAAAVVVVVVVGGGGGGKREGEGEREIGRWRRGMVWLAGRSLGRLAHPTGLIVIALARRILGIAGLRATPFFSCPLLDNSKTCAV